MARVNILYLNVHPGVLILYNKFTRGCSYYIISPPGSETLGEWKYYLTPARTSPTLHPPSPPTVYQLSWLALEELIVMNAEEFHANGLYKYLCVFKELIIMKLIFSDSGDWMDNNVNRCIKSLQQMVTFRNIFWGFKYDLDRSTTHTKVDLTDIQTHDLLIMTVYVMSMRRPF